MSHDSASHEPSARAGVDSMSVKRKRSKTSDPESEASQFDPMAREVLQRMIRLMVLRGLAPKQIEAEVRAICRATPPSETHAEASFNISFEDISHVLTQWYSNPNYLDELGTPRAIPARGSMPSIEALLAEVSPGLGVDETIGFLMQLKALREEGDRFAPLSRHISFAGNPGIYFGRSMRILSAMLRTLEHNAKDFKDARRIEFVATNPRFPKAQLPAFQATLRERSLEFLKHVDSDMFRRELDSQEGEPTTRFGVGIYVFEDEGDDEHEEAATSAIRRASARRLVRTPEPKREPASIADRLTAALAATRPNPKR